MPHSEVLSAAARSRQNATDRTERRSEHPSTQNPPALGCKKWGGAKHPLSYTSKGRCKAPPQLNIKEEGRECTAPPFGVSIKRGCKAPPGLSAYKDKCL